LTQSQQVSTAYAKHIKNLMAHCRRIENLAKKPGIMHSCEYGGLFFLCLRKIQQMEVIIQSL